MDSSFFPSVPGASGVSKQFNLQVIKSAEEVASALSISGQVSYASVFSVSASAKFLSQSSFSRYRTYVVAHCLATFPDQSIANPQLKPEVKEQAKTLTKDEFFQLYGTEFLSGITTGGYYFGIIEIDSTSSSEQQQIAVAVSASGWGASADASISQRLNSVTSHLSKRIFVVREGGPPSWRDPLTPEELIEQAVTFAERAAAHPVIVHGLFQPYEKTFAIEFRSGSGQWNWEERRADLQILGQRFSKLRQLRNDYDFVISHYNDYVTGSGVIFEWQGKPVINVPLAEVTFTGPHVVVESDDPESEPAPVSPLPVTMQALAEEVSRIEGKIREVADAADSCQQGRPYRMPAPYIATVGLPSIKGRNMELENIKQRIVPTGTVAMWSGAVESIPEGWSLCDGKNGTPDLQDRFVCGASRQGEPRPLAQGGPSHHSHQIRPLSLAGVTSVDGQHSHGFPGWYHRGFDDGNYSGIDTNGGHVQDQATNGGGQHSHSVSVGLPEFPTAPYDGELKPKWFALCFIMKL